MSDKKKLYDDVTKACLATLEGEENTIARMATVVCLLVEAFSPRYFWTGFYIVDPKKEDELVVGPYQGTLGCLRIAFGRGVCGTAAIKRETQIVEDVHQLANHIACDSRSNSEIVVPVFDKTGRLIAVFDVDSTDFAAFDEEDKKGLEKLIEQVFSL